MTPEQIARKAIGQFRAPSGMGGFADGHAQAHEELVERVAAAITADRTPRFPPNGVSYFDWVRMRSAEGLLLIAAMDHMEEWMQGQTASECRSHGWHDGEFQDRFKAVMTAYYNFKAAK